MGASRTLAARRRFLQRLTRGFFAATTRREVHGLAQLPAGPAILASNHLSHTDPALLLSVLPHPPAIVGLEDLQRRLVAPLFLFYGTIPVRRDAVDRGVLHAIGEALAAGEHVLLCPEARISRTGALEEARAGVGYLAMQAAVPVVPIAITGTERLPRAWTQGQRPTLTVTFGPPLAFHPDPAQPRRQQREAWTEAVMQAIAALLPVEYRGVYG